MTARLPDQLTCKQIVEVVTDYVEGRLAVDERTRFEHHLVYCEGCRRYVDQMRATIRAAGAVREESLPEETRGDLLRLFRDWKKAKR
jgi:anti-sigma factor RsiW